MRAHRVVVVTAALGAGLGAASAARADGELSMRGVYYKERATRVIQPMLDARFDVGDSGTAQGHLLVDAITSASVAAGNDGEGFTERRVEGGAGYRHKLGTLDLGGQARYSSEPDYTSLFVGLRGSDELFDRNLTLTVAGNVGTDQMSNAGAPPMVPRIEDDLTTYLGSVSVAQLLGPNLVAALTYDVGYLDGQQANLYRAVIAGGALVAERHPAERTRQAVAGSLKWFVPRSVTTVIASYRYYHDDWDVDAQTPELRVIQDVGDNAAFALRYRYHRQDAAYFYEKMYDSSTLEFLSDDVKLSAFDSHTVGAQLDVAGAAVGFTDRLGEVRGQIVIEYVDQNNRFGNALVAHAALTVPFAY